MNTAPQPEPADEAASAATESARLAATAYHEAGHAVMALAVGRAVQKVTIVPGNMLGGGVRLGACEMKKGRAKSSHDAVEESVLILLAGMVAEAHFTDRYCPQGAAQDLRAARRLLQGRAASQRQLERLERRLVDKTEHLLSEAGKAKAIESIAAELVQRTTLSGRAVRHLYEQAERPHRD
ncbi:MAG: M50 family metallopeptidase [Planctomycetales bacterium]|nr:M50 family metallopeptidase [Planctomycetales bacterium]